MNNDLKLSIMIMATYVESQIEMNLSYYDSDKNFVTKKYQSS